MGSPGISSPRVQKRELKKHSRKKRLVKKIVDYLKSDSYMFAPLVSSQVPSDFLPPTNPLPIPATVEIIKLTEGKNKKLHEKVGDYLMSDSHMYAQLMGPQPSHGVDDDTAGPHSGPVPHLKKVVAAEVTTRKISQPTENTVEVNGGDESSENIHLKSRIALQTTVAHRESVKHIVHQHCRSLITGKVGLGTEQRKLVVE